MEKMKIGKLPIQHFLPHIFLPKILLETPRSTFVETGKFQKRGQKSPSSAICRGLADFPIGKRLLVGQGFCCEEFFFGLGVGAGR